MSARKVPDTLGPFYGSFTDGFQIRLPCIELKVKKTYCRMNQKMYKTKECILDVCGLEPKT